MCIITALKTQGPYNHIRFSGIEDIKMKRKMPRYDDRRGSGTRLYVGHLSSRTRSRDLEDMFRRYGR
ncbi:hypothetical protein Goklo_002705 [Gossypium klotzschianum]|uniref:RRM domain-containing protein n=1 Tax=Gossypium klotzschianum TaxID=34286 RepID=A0A7J8VTZ2_9ROSI|nr:hypothetical protein [Gossypium klotzschianum]